jgi:DNA end-binding protein Ku
MSARAIGSGVLSFGLVSIPFKVYVAASSQNVEFNFLHKKCGGRVKQEFRCPVCTSPKTMDNAVVERTDMVKGFEFAKDQYAQFTDEELKKLESVKNDSLEIEEFVPVSTVDLVYVEKSYYLGPDNGADRAYSLFTQAMGEKNVVAVGRYWTRGRQQLVVIEPQMTDSKIGLVMHYMYYANEVRSFDEIAIKDDAVFPGIEMKLAYQLIDQLRGQAFRPERYRDEYQDRIREAVDQKVTGRELVIESEAPKPAILNLFEALKRSVEPKR